MNPETELAFPGTDDLRTVQEVSDYIKAKNIVIGVEG